MRFNPLTYNSFLYGFIPALIIPVLFIWIYLNRFFPVNSGFWQSVLLIYDKVLFGKLLLLSSMPDMAMVFVFYKTDTFKTATGFMTGGMPFLIASFFFI